MVNQYSIYYHKDNQGDWRFYIWNGNEIDCNNTQLWSCGNNLERMCEDFIKNGGVYNLKF